LRKEEGCSVHFVVSGGTLGSSGFLKKNCRVWAGISFTMCECEEPLFVHEPFYVILQTRASSDARIDKRGKDGEQDQEGQPTVGLRTHSEWSTLSNNNESRRVARLQFRGGIERRIGRGEEGENGREQYE
jgi:hypothetical protein